MFWRKLKIDSIFDYHVSDNGDVKALKKTVRYSDGRLRRYSERILSNRIDGKGYLFVNIYSEERKFKQVRVHTLVASTFINNPENKCCVNHKDGNRKNNNVSNLEWVTNKENTQDGISRGTINKPGKKISNSQVIQIRELWKTGNMSQREIAKSFRLGQSQISRICNRKNWIFPVEN